MGSFKLGKMTLRSLFNKPETVMYPAETRFAPEGLRGHITNDMSKCILCSICEKRCPCGAIKVDKPNETWTIDYFRCVQCNTCVDECPKNSISMLPTFTSPAETKGLTVLHKPELTEEEKAELAAKAAAKAARIKAAQAAKAAREAAAKEETNAESGTSK